MYSRSEIIETINMIRHENLDIRTITMGISLRDCACESVERATQRSMIRFAVMLTGWFRQGGYRA